MKVVYAITFALCLALASAKDQIVPKIKCAKPDYEFVAATFTKAKEVVEAKK